MYIIETKKFNSDVWVTVETVFHELDAYTRSFRYDTPNNIVRVRKINTIRA